MANFTTKTIKEIYDEFIANYTIMRAKYGDNTPLLEKALVKSIGYAIAAIAAGLWRMALYIYKQCFPQTCDLTILKLWGELIGVNYLYGKTTNLNIRLSDVSADYLPSGTVFKDLESGLIYKTISQAARKDNLINVIVACSTPGPDGNVSVGTVLNIANPLDGIPSVATVTSVTIEGSNDEDVEVYRKRVMAKFRNKAQGGSALDYYNWALEVPGIVDVLVYTLSEGVVSLYLVAEGTRNKRNPSGSIKPNPFPNWVEGEFKEFEGTGQLLQVANAIEGSEPGLHDRRPVTAKVRLLNPNYTPFSISITNLSNVAFNQEIKNALIDALDAKRPNVKVLNYKVSNSKINRLALSAVVSEIIGDETFTNFILKNEAGTSIEEATLGIGCLAYLSQLDINGVRITL